MDQVANSGLELELKRKKKVRTAPGGFWVRAGALIIDGIILSVVQAPVSILNGFMTASLSVQNGQQVDPNAVAAVAASSVLAVVISMALTFAYAGFFLWKKGATPGKMVFGLKVVNVETGKNLSFLRAGFRDTIGKFISSIVLCIGYFMAAFREDKKGLHDLMFSSQVLKVKK